MAEANGNQQGQTDDILDSNYDFLIKFMLLGDSGVGKTCFLHRYMEGEFRSRFTATVGVDFRLKKLEYDFPEDDGEETKKKIHLQIWDTAGQERYRSLTKAFFRDGMGFLLLYDVGNVETFHSVREWLSEIKEEAYCENPDIILIGNKNDLETRAVTEKQGKQLAHDLKIPYMETSCATGDSVNESVLILLKMVLHRMRKYVENARLQRVYAANAPETSSEAAAPAETPAPENAGADAEDKPNGASTEEGADGFSHFLRSRSVRSTLSTDTEKDEKATVNATCNC